MVEVKNDVVTLQSQEVRTEVDGEEVFGEILYVNGQALGGANVEESAVGIAITILDALGIKTEVLPDLEPVDEGDDVNG